MRIATSHIIIGIGALVLLSQGENVRGSLEKNNQIRQEQSDFNDRIRQSRREGNESEKLSKVALSRYKSNCIFVVDTIANRESYFQLGSSVVDTSLNRPLRAGVPICNRLGDTGIVSQAGTITDIARVAVPDLPQFRKTLQQRK